MIKRKLLLVLSIVVVACMLLVSCKPAPTEAPPAVEPTEEEPVVEEPTEAPETEAPTELHIAAITCCSIESMWDATWVQAVERIKNEKPHGLEITLDYTENMWGDEAEMALREYAETGKYDIIFATSSFSDQVANLKDEFPEILWVYHGSGNEPLGDNAYWVYLRVHEPAYLLGMAAGMMTKTNLVGAVGTFAFDDVNDEINAFFQGAKDVNPEVHQRVTFIESWYDPAKGVEATNAQASAGVDFILQLADGWEACVENDILCFGNFGDQSMLAPGYVPSSTLSLWDPSIKWIIDEWYRHVTTGEPYHGNMEKKWFTMAEGGAGFVPLDPNLIPQDVFDAVEKKKQEILDGTFAVPLYIEVPVSD